MTCHLSEQSKAIIGKYAKSDHADENYIFPILDRRIHKTEQQIYDRVRKVLKHVNKALHEWSRLLGLKIEPTTYVARHTFATVLKRSGVNIAIISESLGHSDLSTTQIYLDSFENSQIDTITATVKVTNAGDYDGEEVVQLYIRDLKAQITRPVKELKGFRKIFLKKGESADVTFDITRAELEYVLADGSVVSDPGEFELFIGGSSAGLQPVRFGAL